MASPPVEDKGISKTVSAATGSVFTPTFVRVATDGSS
jgi:hypothetical protein